MLKITTVACAALLAVACGKSNGNSKSNTPAPGLDNEVQARRSIDSFKWIGAITIEGGFANQDNTGLNNKNPSWRLHVCFERSEKVKEQKVKVNLAEMPLFKEQIEKIKADPSNSLNPSRTFEKIVFLVSYQTRVVSEHGFEYSVSAGSLAQKITFRNKAGEVITESSSEKPVDWDHNTLGWSATSYYYHGGGTAVPYVKAEVERIGYFGANPKELTPTSCEGQDEPYFIEVL